MRRETVGDVVSTLLLQKCGSEALLASAQRWLDANRDFTKWIHHHAKRSMSDDEFLRMASKEEECEQQLNSVLSAYRASPSSVGETQVISALDQMTELRKMLQASC